MTNSCLLWQHTNTRSQVRHAIWSQSWRYLSLLWILEVLDSIRLKVSSIPLHLALFLALPKDTFRFHKNVKQIYQDRMAKHLTYVGTITKKYSLDLPAWPRASCSCPDFPCSNLGELYQSACRNLRTWLSRETSCLKGRVPAWGWLWAWLSWFGKEVSSKCLLSERRHFALCPHNCIRAAARMEKNMPGKIQYVLLAREKQYEIRKFTGESDTSILLLHDKEVKDVLACFWNHVSASSLAASSPSLAKLDAKITLAKMTDTGVILAMIFRWFFGEFPASLWPEHEKSIHWAIPETWWENIPQKKKIYSSAVPVSFHWPTLMAQPLRAQENRLWWLRLRLVAQWG